MVVLTPLLVGVITLDALGRGVVVLCPSSHLGRSAQPSFLKRWRDPRSSRLRPVATAC